MSRVRVESRQRLRGRGRRARAALVRLSAVVACAAVVAVGGCGGDSADAPALPADPGRALANSAAALRELGTFTFEASFTRVKATTPDDVEEYSTAHGALDLAADKGRAELDLAPLFPGQQSPLDHLKVDWTAKSLTTVLDEKSRTVDRARARDSGGLIGRYPDEVEALDDLLAMPSRPRLVERDDGTAHYAFSFEAKAAGRRGIPAELSGAFEQALHGPRLELEAWIEEDGLPHRISYAVHLEPVRGSFSLPRRTVRVTYELDDFGDEYDPNG